MADVIDIAFLEK